MEIDWGDGDYGRTAAELAPTAAVLVAVAGVGAGDRVLDVGCGTGNASVAAAAAGADVWAVDPAERLVALARGRSVRARVAAADALPFPDGDFHAVISNFAVIFAPDAEAAVREMVRVTRPGGVVALTTWLPGGGVDAAGKVLRSLVPPPPDPPRWDDPDWAIDLLARAGAPGATAEHREITFEAPSAAAWFAEEEAHHPVWRALRRHATAAAWDDVRARSIRALEAHDDGDGAFRTTSRYAVIRSEREKRPPDA